MNLKVLSNGNCKMDKNGILHRHCLIGKVLFAVLNGYRHENRIRRFQRPILTGRGSKISQRNNFSGEFSSQRSAALKNPTFYAGIWTLFSLHRRQRASFASRRERGGGCEAK